MFLVFQMLITESSLWWFDIFRFKRWCKAWPPRAWWGLPRWEGDAVSDIPKTAVRIGGFWGGLKFLRDAAKSRFKIQKTPKPKPYSSVFTNLFGTYCIWILWFYRLGRLLRFKDPHDDCEATFWGTMFFCQCQGFSWTPWRETLRLGNPRVGPATNNIGGWDKLTGWRFKNTFYFHPLLGEMI